MCKKCNCELISRAGLRKRTKRCQGIVGHDIDQDECKNGPLYWYFKNNKCNFKHSQSYELPWKKVERRRQGRQLQQGQRQPQGQQQRPGHHNQQGQRQQQQPKKQFSQQQTRQESIKCKNGPRCSFLMDNRCSSTRPQSSTMDSPGRTPGSSRGVVLRTRMFQQSR